MTQAEGRQVNVGFCSHHTMLLCAPLNHWIREPKVYIALSNESLAKKNLYLFIYFFVRNQKHYYISKSEITENAFFYN